jgi:signal transduction histidine kinase
MGGRLPPFRFRFEFSPSSPLFFILYLIIASPLHPSEAEERTVPLTADTAVLYAGQYLDILETPDDSHNLQDIRRDERWSPYCCDEIPSFGFDRTVRWFRLRVKNPEISAQRLYLELQWPFLPHVDLHSPDGKGGYKKHSGGFLEKTGGEAPNRFLLFRIEIPPGFNDYLYLKIRTKSSFQVPLALYSERSYILQMEERETRNGIYIGILFGLLLYNLVQFLTSRDTIHLYYILSVGSLTIGILTVAGYLIRYGIFVIYTENTSGITIVFTGMQAILQILFLDRFFQIRKKTNIYYMLRSFIAAILMISALAYFMRPYPAYINIALGTYLSIQVVLNGTVFFLYFSGNAIARYYLPGFTAITFSFLLEGMRSMGAAWSNSITFHAPYAGLLLEGTFFTLAIGDRYSLLKKRIESLHREFQNERLRIARELHDSVGSELTFVLYDLKGRQRGEAARWMQAVENVIRRLKDIVFLLNQEKDASLTLEVEMHAQIRRLSHLKRLKIHSDLEQSGDLLNLDVRLHLWRIFNEWLANIARHSGAENIRISWKRRKNGWIMAIEDDGSGFSWKPRLSVQIASHDKGLHDISFGSGLKNIAFRATEINARVRVFGSAGRGSLFVLLLRI